MGFSSSWRCCSNTACESRRRTLGCNGKKGATSFHTGHLGSIGYLERVKAELQGERSTNVYQKRRANDARRRDQAQVEYVEQFKGAVKSFLAFNPIYAELAETLARAVADHATPVGSGTVARTKRVPIQRRAEAAVIAWMRHSTTAYDSLKIPRVKGKRREIRRMLAQHSKELLNRYRQGEIAGDKCELKLALKVSETK
jgi:hypothetical protein